MSNKQHSINGAEKAMLFYSSVVLVGSLHTSV